MAPNTKSMKRQRSMEETTNLIHLPDEILDNILCRLPVESICTCKCVCKHFHSIITNPKFHPKIDSEFLLVLDKSLTPSISLYLVDEYDHKLNFELFYTQSSNYSNENFVVSNSCDGFVILAIGNTFYLFNPLIHVYVKVLTLNCSMRNSIAVVGICYDASIDDYKVVVQYKNRLGRRIVAVACLKTKNWVQIEFPFDIESIKTGPIVNRRMHWIVDDKPEIRSKKIRSKKIIYFDASENSFKELPSPQPFEFSGGNNYICLGNLGGFLAIVRMEKWKIQILTMKEYGVKGSWTFLRASPSILGLGSFLFRSNNEILYQSNGNVYAYDSQEEKTTRTFPLLKSIDFSNAVLIGHNFTSQVGYELDDKSRIAIGDQDSSRK